MEEPILVTSEEEIKRLITRQYFKFYCKNCGKEVVMKYCGLHFINRYKNLLCRKCSYISNTDFEKAATKRKITWNNTSDEIKKEIVLKRSNTRKKLSKEEKDRIRQKIVKSYMEHFGIDNPMKLESVKEKTKQTKLNKYGDENYNNRDKARETSVAIYGTDNPLKSEKVKNKLKQTFNEKYGVNSVGNLLGVKKINDKAKETKIKLYGDPNYNNREQAKETIKNKALEEKQEIQNKIYKTNLEKYGTKVPNMTGTEDFKNSMIKKYGVDNPMKLESVKEKTKQTKLNKYGDENYTNVDKQKETNTKKRGVEWNVLAVDFKEKSKSTCLSKYGKETYLGSKDCLEKTKETMLSQYNSLHVNYSYSYYGAYFDSSWELAVWIYCIDHNISIIREPYIFQYTYDNKIHMYIPDFLINGKLIEIKGDQFFKEDGTMYFPYNKLHHDNKELSEKEKEYYDGLYEAKQQCGLQNGVIFWKSSECKEYVDYCNTKYSKDYLNKFKINNPYNPSYFGINGYYQLQKPYNNIPIDYASPISKGISPYDIDNNSEYSIIK